MQTIMPGSQSIPGNSQAAVKLRYLHYKVGISSMKAFRQDSKKQCQYVKNNLRGGR